MDKRIIINADDFGLSEPVNNAVAKAHTEGVLTSATIMANMPAADEAVKIARKLPGLGVGVHLNLSEGAPLSKDSSIECLLNIDGEFALSVLKLSVLSIAGHKIRNAIRTELAAQIQWILDKGLTPTHLDSHYHIHTLPPIFPIVCDLARRFEIPAVRFRFEPKDLCRMPWPLPAEGGRQRARTGRIMARINRLQDSRFLKTDAFLGIAHKGKIDVSFFKAVTLYSSARTAEVMTHPGLADTAGPDETKRQHQQRLELEALCSERTKQHFDDAAIRLVHYGNL
jgi:hopanoid biosynthesis associated protein HpnK